MKAKIALKKWSFAAFQFAANRLKSCATHQFIFVLFTIHLWNFRNRPVMSLMSTLHKFSFGCERNSICPKPNRGWHSMQSKQIRSLVIASNATLNLWLSPRMTRLTAINCSMFRFENQSYRQRIQNGVRKSALKNKPISMNVMAANSPYF